MSDAKIRLFTPEQEAALREAFDQFGTSVKARMGEVSRALAEPFRPFTPEQEAALRAALSQIRIRPGGAP